MFRIGIDGDLSPRESSPIGCGKAASALPQGRGRPCHIMSALNARHTPVPKGLSPTVPCSASKTRGKQTEKLAMLIFQVVDETPDTQTRLFPFQPAL